MAIAFTAAADGGNNGGTTNSLTFSYTVGTGSGRLLIVALVGDIGAGADDITSVTYGGAAMSLLNKLVAQPSQNRDAYFYYLLNPASGANNVVINSTANHFLIAGAADYSGVSASDASTTNISAGAASTLTTSLTTVADNSWVTLVEEGFDASTAPLAGAGATRRALDAAFGTWGIFDSNGPVHPAGSYSMTTTYAFAANPIAHLMGSFSPAAGGRTISAADTLANFTDAAAFTNIDHILSASSLAPFVDSAILVNVDHIVTADTLGRFASAAAFHNSAGASNIQRVTRQARKQNQPMGFE